MLRKRKGWSHNEFSCLNPKMLMSNEDCDLSFTRLSGMCFSGSFLLSPRMPWRPKDSSLGRSCQVRAVPLRLVSWRSFLQGIPSLQAGQVEFSRVHVCLSSGELGLDRLSSGNPCTEKLPATSASTPHDLTVSMYGSGGSFVQDRPGCRAQLPQPHILKHYLSPFPSEQAVPYRIILYTRLLSMPFINFITSQ